MKVLIPLLLTVFCIPGTLHGQNNTKEALIKKTKEYETALQQAFITEKKSAGAPELNNASLEQNMPAPFNQTNVIRYFVPASADHVTLVIADTTGQLVKCFPILAKGAGQTIIAAGDLAPGSYFYILLIDRKKMITRQMLLTR